MEQMQMTAPSTVQNKREAWVEPEMRQLDVRETATAPHLGGDGDTTYSDCSKS